MGHGSRAPRGLDYTLPSVPQRTPDGAGVSTSPRGKVRATPRAYAWPSRVVTSQAEFGVPAASVIRNGGKGKTR